MARWTIGKRLLGAFGLIGIVVLIMAVSALRTSANLRGNVDELTEVTTEVLFEAGQAQFYIADMRAGVRASIIAATEQNAAEVATRAEGTEKSFDDLLAAETRLSQTTRL